MFGTAVEERRLAAASRAARWFHLYDRCAHVAQQHAGQVTVASGQVQHCVRTEHRDHLKIGKPSLRWAIIAWGKST